MLIFHAFTIIYGKGYGSKHAFSHRVINDFPQLLAIIAVYLPMLNSVSECQQDLFQIHILQSLL